MKAQASLAQAPARLIRHRPMVGRLSGRQLWLAALMLLALALRLTGIGFGLPLQLHPDEWSQVETARRMLEGDLNPHFFRYPTLFIYQLHGLYTAAQALAIVGLPALSGSDYFLLGRLLSAAYGTLTVWATYRLGRSILNAETGLAAAALLAVAPEHVRQSHYATVDVAMSFWAVLALALALQAARSDEPSFTPAGIAAGLALSSKYSAIFLVPPLLVLAAWKAWQSGRPRWLSGRWLALGLVSTGAVGLLMLWWLPLPDNLALLRGWTSDGNIEADYLSLLETARLAGSVAAVAFTLFGLGTLRDGSLRQIAGALIHPLPSQFLLASFGTFLLTSPYVLLDVPHAARDIAYELRHVLTGASAQFAVGDPALATLGQPGLLPQPAFYWDWWLSQNGWPMLLAAILGAALLFSRNVPAFFVTAAIVLSLALSLTRAANKSERYALLLVPVLALWAAAGLYWLSRRPGARFRRALYAGLIAAAGALPLVSTWSILHSEFLLPDSRVIALRWLEQYARPGAVVVREYNTPDLEHTDLPVETIVVRSAFEGKTLDDWQRAGVRYILVGPMRAWYGARAFLYPAVVENYAALDRRTRLLRRFEPADGGRGPTVELYQLP